MAEKHGERGEDRQGHLKGANEGAAGVVETLGGGDRLLLPEKARPGL